MAHESYRAKALHFGCDGGDDRVCCCPLKDDVMILLPVPGLHVKTDVRPFKHGGSSTLCHYPHGMLSWSSGPLGRGLAPSPCSFVLMLGTIVVTFLLHVHVSCCAILFVSFLFDLLCKPVFSLFCITKPRGLFIKARRSLFQVLITLCLIFLSSVFWLPK